MTRQKSRFLTFIFSLVPGCGEMYMGFMKRGVSLLLLFFVFLWVPVLNSLGALAVVVWCYAFFDSMNLMTMQPERFASVEDDWIFGRLAEQFDMSSEKTRRIAGIALIVFGSFTVVSVIWGRVADLLYDNYRALYNILYSVVHTAPKLIICVVIIAAGVWLISGRKKAMLNDDTSARSKENGDENDG